MLPYMHESHVLQHDESDDREYRLLAGVSGGQKPSPSVLDDQADSNLVLRVIVCFAIGALAALPNGIGWRGRLVLGAFIWCLSGFMLLPIPNVIIVLSALGFLGITDTLSGTSEPTLFWGFAQPTTWLVVSAIHISAAVTASGLGQR